MNAGSFNHLSLNYNYKKRKISVWQFKPLRNAAANFTLNNIIRIYKQSSLFLSDIYSRNNVYTIDATICRLGVGGGG
jgi:hypothetical protein